MLVDGAISTQRTFEIYADMRCMPVLRRACELWRAYENGSEWCWPITAKVCVLFAHNIVCVRFPRFRIEVMEYPELPAYPWMLVQH